ncbi:MAG: aminopeptidase [Lachnospiraceae bacterium]|nr:aminopeptidase [Lachnospiraceae bacterium]
MDNHFILRYELIKERALEIDKSASLLGIYDDYFKTGARFILNLMEVYKSLRDEKRESIELAKFKDWQDRLYSDILADNYDQSYTNPKYAVSVFGKDIGQKLCFLAAELRSVIPYAYRKDIESIVLFGELFIQVETIVRDFVCENNSDNSYLANEINSAIYSFELDNSEIFVANRQIEMLDSSITFAKDIIMNSDLTDLKYLYYFGEYIGENEVATFNYLNSLEKDKLVSMAYTFTHGYDEGFKVMRIDRTNKETVNIRYQLGFELMIREAIKQFEDLGLKAVIYPVAARCQDKRLPLRIGYQAKSANKQYDYDHRFDNALYFDRRYMLRRLEVLRATLNDNKALAAKYAGPAVLEIFGEEDFEPVIKEEALSLSNEQKELALELSREASIISNEYLKQDEISFTIIAYPVKEIADNYEEIFEETIKVNTLDNDKYRAIQQHLIDALDKADYVRVIGADENATDMKVMLHKLNDPSKQTNFENCVADVNIPLGEVFTSPVLAGTEGMLNVSSAYLNDLYFKNIKLEFADGKVVDYSCDNYDSLEDNKAFIEENLLRNHKTLPIGEFAIGTNTVAYSMAKKFDIIEKLPILIVEKTGPHFAIGDTCYSHAEDHKVYNPDGKEIIARENECSALRNSDPKAAYFNVHTDITIPYEEIGVIYAHLPSGEEIKLIENGRFVLYGTEFLNEALDI